MARRFASVLTLGAVMMILAACADTTAPKNTCQITSGGLSCTPD